MVTWEYRVESFDFTEKWRPKKQAEEIAKFQQRLNELGTQGWEMVSYESIPMVGSFSKDVKGYAYLLFFKREAQ